MRIKEKKSRPIRNIFFAGLLISVIYYFYQNRPEPVASEVKHVEAVPIPEAAPTEDQAKEPGSSSTETTTRVQEFQPQLKHEIQKLNAYTYCMNRQSSRAMSSWSRYLSWVDPAVGPQADSKHKYGVYTIYDVDACQKRLREAESLPVKWPESEEAAGKYEKAMVTLYDMLIKVDRYYDQEDYLDDQMKGGQAMHEGLMQAYYDYAVADSLLRKSLVSHRRDILLALETDALEQATPSLYHGLQLLGPAVMMVDYAKQEDLGDIDTTALKEHLNEFSQALDEARAWYEANEKGDSRLIYGVSSLVNNAEKLQKDTKKLIRALRDYEPAKASKRTSPFRSIRMTTRYKSEVIRMVGSYNSFLSAYNRLTPFRAEMPYPQWTTELRLPRDVSL